MTQTVAVDVPLGPARTGLAIGAIVYALDGSTVISEFDVTGWYEAPAGTGDWHHPGVVGPDAGGVIAVGVAGTEYRRQAFETAAVDAPGTASIVDAIKAYEVETGHTFDDVLKRIYAVIRGEYLANDPNRPTELLFYAPDGTTVRVTFAFNADGTTRTPS